MGANSEAKESHRTNEALVSEGHRKNHIQTTINYYNDPGDGSPPMPVYVGRYGPSGAVIYRRLVLMDSLLFPATR